MKPYFENEADTDPRIRTIVLTDLEYQWLTKDAPRCDHCGHLVALHNSHCCSFCMIPECKCEE